MTQQMRQEAVFMRIITLVTLFFLPGTFVSVSHQERLKVSRIDNLLQTLMSTDIIHWQTSAPGGLEKVVSSGAILIFLVLTGPFMIVTFAAAYGFYRWSKRSERKKMERRAAELAQP